MRFRLKITLCFTAFLAVAFAIGGSLMIAATYEEMLSRETDGAMEDYQMILSTAGVLSMNQETEEPALLSTLANVEPGSGWDAVRLMDRDGIVRFAGGLGPAFRQDVTAAAEADRCAVGVFTDAEYGRFLQLSGMVTVDGTEMYLETVTRLDDGIYAARDAMLSAYRRIFAVLVPLSAVGCYLLSLLLTIPLGRLRSAVRQLAEGDLKARAVVRSQDEVGALAKDFNRMADHMEKSFEELQTSMERQELFMGSFAHELKTPMTSIIGYADLIRGQRLSPAEQQESANYIFSEGKRLESLSLKLLDLLVLKRQDFPLTEASVPALLEDTVALIRPNLAESRLKLRYHFGQGSCMMEPDLVKSLVMNLIDNARKAMEPGGEIRLTSAMTAEGCIIVVQDSGRGMAPEELEKITRAFYRVDKARSRAQGGAGLGLSLCREIVDLHHGAMEFESSPGQGTTVTVELRGGRR